MTTTTITRGSAVAERRKQQFKDNWTEFTRTRSGLVGAVLLLIVILLSVITPILVPADTLDVTKITAAQNEPPTAAHLLGTRPAGTCSGCCSGAPGSPCWWASRRPRFP
jgi:peptide/nickel transport system permease protein